MTGGLYGNRTIKIVGQPEPTRRYDWAEPQTEVIDSFSTHVHTVPDECLGHTFDAVMAGRTPLAPTIIRIRKRRKSLNHWVLFGVAAVFFVLGVMWAPVAWELM